MCRRYLGMHHEAGEPGWMRYGHPGSGLRHGRGPSNHGAMPREGPHRPLGIGHWGLPPTAQEERELLSEQAEALRRYLERIQRRLRELEPGETERRATV